MEKNDIHEPVELQEQFLRSLDALARADEAGKLKCISHEELMVELDALFSSARNNIRAFEGKNPQYAENSTPRMQI